MKKLLVVDDNLDYLRLLVSIMKKHFEVYEASGVKEALQVLENTKAIPHRKVGAILPEVI